MRPNARTGQQFRRNMCLMETTSSPSNSTAAGDTAPAGLAAGAPLRLAGRPDVLTAQKVEVGIILQAMLGTTAAAEYLENNAINRAVALRVLFQPELRRGRHDAFGIRC
jgi:hypothetical protein